MHRKILVFLTVLFLTVALAGPLGAANRSGSITFPVQGSQEVPAVDTEASGECTGYLNPLRTAFDISCTHDATNAVMAHIHSAPSGVNGPIVFFLEPATSFSFRVSEETLQQQADDGLPVAGIDFEEFLSLLDAGGLYVNIHTPTNPGGEIRGQIPAPPCNTYFAQFGAGSDGTTSFNSDIVLLNSATTGAPVTGEITFYNPEGVLIPPSELIESDEGGGSLGAASSLAFELEPLGDLTISTNRSGDVLAGSARVSSDGLVSGVLRFDISGVGVAGVPEGGVLNGAIAPVRRLPSGLSSGIALVNPGNDAIEVNLSLRQNGVEVDDGSSTVLVASNGRFSLFLEQLFPDADTSDFAGTVVITADGGFSAIVVEFDAANGIFTTLPVVPLQ